MTIQAAVPTEQHAVKAEAWLDILATPGGGASLRIEGSALLAVDDGKPFAISPAGVPLIVSNRLSAEARQQEEHYDRIASVYLENLKYPHTQEYMNFLDCVLLDTVGLRSLGTVAELCCGHGEALGLAQLAFDRYIGIDVSQNMLEAGARAHPSASVLFVQADATAAPIKSQSIDTVLMLGGIHHVPDRQALFREVGRILKPEGRFLFREPVSDFFLWRWLRWLAYRISPMLDHTTERPLVFEETDAPLRQAGLELKVYRTVGFIGFCLFMNSDVLVFNRLFRLIPGIETLTRLSTQLDSAALRLPFMKRAGLQVVGEARKVAPL